MVTKGHNAETQRFRQRKQAPLQNGSNTNQPQPVVTGSNVDLASIRKHPCVEVSAQRPSQTVEHVTCSRAWNLMEAGGIRELGQQLLCHHAGWVEAMHVLRRSWSMRSTFWVEKFDDWNGDEVDRSADDF
jgi:hypothetical protein